MICDNINFTPEEILPQVMRVFGWKLSEDFKVHNGIALVRADFYPIGHVLGYSEKATLVCDGETKIIYKNKVYLDFKDLLEVYGEKAYETFPEWEIVIEKQWAVKKYSGEWVAAFTNLAEMPYRKQVRC